MGENGEWHLEREREKEKKRESHFCRKMKCDGYQGNLNKEGRKKKRRQRKIKKEKKEKEKREGKKVKVRPMWEIRGKEK